MQACLQMTERERIIQIRKPSSAAKSKVPFYRSLNLEIERPFRNGTSYNLMNTLAEEYAGKVMRPLNVKDANFPKGRVNEYIFSPTAPNPKSMWNTLDFAPGGGPMAYISTNITGNNYA